MAKTPKRNTCSAPGCTRVTHARGLCQMHYDRTRKRHSGRRAGFPAPGGVAPPVSTGRAMDGSAPEEDVPPNGEFDVPRPPPRVGHAACSVPGCGAAHHAKGYCKSHYSRLRRRGRIRGGRGSQLQVCEVAGCSKAVVRNRRCGEHLGDAGPGGVRHMTKAERLAEFRRRHERMRREIERIRQSFEREREEGR